ncbi:MAG: SRPBCC family protein [Dehalococcoidia bacterium]|nr:SRPBCC family protein [Dehalococcoidia bacterium]
MPDSIKLSVTLSATPEQVYEAWLSSEEHTAFTGDEATIDPTVGGNFVAGSGYIKGTTLELEPYSRIVQSWRSTDFPESAEDSLLEVLLERTRGGTRLTLVHTNIPDGQAEEYEQGWKDFYFEPMKRYFSEKGTG